MNMKSFDAFYGIHQFECGTCKKPSQMPLLVYLRWYMYYTDIHAQCVDCTVENVVGKVKGE